MTDRAPLTDVQVITAQLRPHEITLRPITPDDLPFLFQVYASTRMEELAQTQWSAEQTTAFLTMQFNAQHAYYQEHYPQAAFLIIEHHGQPVGRLYLDRWPNEIRIVDIALLPPQRRRGIGTQLLNAVLEEGQRLHLPVRIHVEVFNPALHLYTRLGFRQIEDKGVYSLMEKAPDA
jgi:ribosomal protein S18 acetylase RimI-like enzyme